MKIHLIILAATLAARPRRGRRMAGSGQWLAAERDDYAVEHEWPDPSGRRIGTVEQGIGDRLIILDTTGAGRPLLNPGSVIEW